MNTILDFCGCCGVLLEEGLGLEEEPTCSNCGVSVKDLKDRIQGSFTEEDATRLKAASGVY
jgi:hypothetical protein